MKTKKAASPAARRTPRAASAARETAPVEAEIAAASPGGELAAAEAATIDITFADLGLTAPMLKALADAGYQRPTPIQAQAVPLALKGRDVIGLAMTGTGKTAAFVIPDHRTIARRPETHARAHPHADSRTVRAGRGEFPQVRQAFRASRHSRVRRRRLRAAGEGAARGASTSSSRRRGACSTISRSRMSCSTKSRCWCSTKPTACSTWASRRRSTGSSRSCHAYRQTLLFSATMPPEVEALARKYLRKPVVVQVGRRSVRRPRCSTSCIRARRTRRPRCSPSCSRRRVSTACSSSRARSTAPIAW